MKHVKTTLSAVALVAALGLSLTACGGTATSSPTAPTAAPVGGSASTAAAAAPAEAAKSPRGNIVKKFGEGAGVTDMISKKEVVNFAVNSITPGTCTDQYAQPPVNGHIVFVDVTVETKPELADATMKSFSLSGYDFKFVSANGTTFNGNLSTAGSVMCIPAAEAFPMAGMGPGEKITAKVVLDVPEPSGILVLKAPFSNTNGWEYNF
jgi:hypothetical protein